MTKETATQKELLKQLWALHENKPAITRPLDVIPILMKWAYKKQECFIVVTLSASHTVIKAREVTKGILNKCLIHPREVFRPAIQDMAAAIIIAHNHPSGKPNPSPEDWEITKRMTNAGDVLGIPVLDHIIIAGKGFYSFTGQGLVSCGAEPAKEDRHYEKIDQHT